MEKIVEFQFQKLLPVLFGTRGMLLSTIEVGQSSLFACTIPL